MAQGGVFSLALADERFDRFFTASAHLRDRLAGLRSGREAAGLSPAAPPPAAVEKTHLLYVAASYRPYAAVASEYTKVRPSGDGASALGPGGGGCQFVLPGLGSFTSDLVVHVRVREVGSAGAAAPTAATPLLRYCALPGARIFSRVALGAGGVVVDEYGPDDVVAEGKFFVGADRRAGWERCLGQQELREAAALGNGYTVAQFYRDGPQTPKLFQPAFEMLIPLGFWFCRGPAHALFNDGTPASQRTVTCDFAPLSDLLSAWLPDPADPGRLVPAALPVGRLAVDVSLYANGLYVNPEIHDLFAARTGFSLVRVHRRQAAALPGPSGSVLLDRLKFPAEFLLAGVRARALARDPDRWWLMGAAPARPPSAALLAPVALWNGAAGLAQLALRPCAEVSALEAAADRLGFSAHGIDLFPDLPSAFYNAYLPGRFPRGGALASPADPHALLVAFCLFPGADAPSGYFNLSAGRELYARYSLAAGDAYVSGSAELVVLMSALNFLLRRGDRLALKYSV